MSYGKPVYQFDIQLNLVCVHLNPREAIESTGLPASQIYTGIGRGSLIYERHYFSYDRNFKPATKKYSRNPLMRPLDNFYEDEEL
jgi:hypothetical protein